MYSRICRGNHKTTNPMWPLDKSNPWSDPRTAEWVTKSQWHRTEFHSGQLKLRSWTGGLVINICPNHAQHCPIMYLSMYIIVDMNNTWSICRNCFDSEVLLNDLMVQEWLVPLTLEPVDEEFRNEMWQTWENTLQWSLESENIISLRDEYFMGKTSCFNRSSGKKRLWLSSASAPAASRKAFRTWS